MKETLHDAHERDQTRIKRAFGWVITFRDFPICSWQTVDAYSMMREALTLFTKGRAEFYLDGERRRDRVPGILSSDEPFEFNTGEFKLVYVEPTTRLCIPASINKGKLPNVRKYRFSHDQEFPVHLGQKFLICLGTVSVGDKVFTEEQTVRISTVPSINVSGDCMLLEFL